MLWLWIALSVLAVLAAGLVAAFALEIQAAGRRQREWRNTVESTTSTSQDPGTHP